MDNICDEGLCTGCGLCTVQCPRKCITMISTGKFGHLYPNIDNNSCIDCGLCKRNCPALINTEKRKPKTAYAAWSKDEEDYKSSTSGGAASIFTQHIISKSGVVYGCAMLPNIEASHIRVDNYEDSMKLKGSKYVQSDITNIMPILKKDVKEGKSVLFIGTPCQVAAIKSSYKEQPQNLLLIDLVCHGVPSLQLLKKHVKRIADYPHYDNVFFRDGNIIGLVLKVNGHVVYKQQLKKPRYKEWYINTFFDGYTYRESCYNCKYACPDRVSDITIGDFWGLGKKQPADEIPLHQYGCSLILPNTEKGLYMIEQIKPKMYLYERSIDEAINGNDQLKRPFKMNRRIRVFRKFYHLFGYQLYYWVLADKVVKTKIKTILGK